MEKDGEDSGVNGGKRWLGSIKDDKESISGLLLPPWVSWPHMSCCIKWMACHVMALLNALFL